jgi:hypothetical protein
MTTQRIDATAQDPTARARREAARLLGALADLDAARHYGLTTAAREHGDCARGILLGLQVDLDMIRRELDPLAVVAEPAYDRTIECPDCGVITGGVGLGLDPYAHECPAAELTLAGEVAARPAATDASGRHSWPCEACGHDLGAHAGALSGVGCLVKIDHEHYCPCDHNRPVVIEYRGDLAGEVDPRPSESELRVLDGNR